MDEPEQRSRWRSLLIFFCFIVGVPLVLCAGVLTWYVGRQSVAADKVHARTENLSQRGQPVDDETLQLAFHVGTSDKNTQQWVDLRKKLDTQAFREATYEMPFHDAYDENDEKIVVPPPGQPWPNRKPVDDFLQQWRAELDMIHLLADAEYASSGKPLRRPIEFRSVATLLPDTQSVRTMARLMQLEHAVATYDGDGQRAYECIRACRGLERSTDGEPLIISQLIGQAVARLAGQMLQRSVEYDQLSDQQMDDLAAKLPAFDKLCDLYELAMSGERAMMLPIFSDPRQAMEILELDNRAGANLLTKTRSSDALYYLELMDQLLSLPRDDMQTFHEAAKNVTSKLNNDARNAGMLEKMDRAMSYMLVPAVDAFAGVIVRQAEHNNLAKLAMAIRKFHHRLERWPASLDELSAIGVDASHLASMDVPFGYKVEDSGEAVAWGVDRSSESAIPPQPPVVEDEDRPNAAWVWRLRP